MRYGLESADQKFEYFGNVTRPGGSDHWMAVVILYLANVTTGGEILFPDSEVRQKFILISIEVRLNLVFT